MHGDVSERFPGLERPRDVEPGVELVGDELILTFPEERQTTSHECIASRPLEPLATVLTWKTLRPGRRCA
jgi:hypothetical protein